jgi:hypothetical protein
VALAALMILPASAIAAPGSGTDPSNPSLDQYVENVPSSHGDHPRPPSGGSPQSGQLSPSVRRQINARGGSDASQLRTVASSPALGAPTSPAGTGSGQRAGGRNGTGGSGEGTATAPAERGPSALSAIASAATHGEGSAIGALVIGLLVIAAVAAGLALARRRGRYFA